VSASTKVKVLIAGLACLNLAVWGAKQLLAGALDPIIRSLGA
jgi:hypothetical protein